MSLGFNSYICKYKIKRTSMDIGHEMTTHSRILAWRIPWTEEPGRLQSRVAELDMTEWPTLSLSCPLGRHRFNSGLSETEFLRCPQDEPGGSDHKLSLHHSSSAGWLASLTYHIIRRLAPSLQQPLILTKVSGLSPLCFWMLKQTKQ